MSAGAFCPHSRDYRDGCLDCLRPVEPMPADLLRPPVVVQAKHATPSQESRHDGNDD